MNSRSQWSLLFLLLLVLGTPVWAQHVLGQIAVGNGPTGIAINPTTNRVYVANSMSNSVSVIDGATDFLITTVTVGNAPQVVFTYVPANLIYAYNASDSTLSIIDGKTNAVLRTRSVPFGMTAAAELGLSKFLYVTDTAADQVHVIDLTSLIKLTDISVPAPSAITINPRTKQAYVTSGNTGIAVIDTGSNTVLHTFTITNTNIGSISIDPGDGLLYAATSPVGSSNTSISVMNPNNGTVLGTSPALGTVNSVLALNGTHKAVATGGKTIGQDVHSLIFIRGSDAGVAAVLANVGKHPFNSAFNPNTKVLFTTNSNSNTVAVVGN